MEAAQGLDLRRTSLLGGERTAARLSAGVVVVVVFVVVVTATVLPRGEEGGGLIEFRCVHLVLDRVEGAEHEVERAHREC